MTKIPYRAQLGWTRVRLSEWGRFCRGNVATGYPTRASFTRANEGGRSINPGSSLMPDRILEVDQAHATLSVDLRSVLFSYYVKGRPFWLRAALLGISYPTFKRRLYTGEYIIHKRLTDE